MIRRAIRGSSPVAWRFAVIQRLLAFLLLSSAAVVAQGSYSAVAWIKSPGNLARLIPLAPVVVCQFPGTGGIPCTNLAATFTDAKLVTESD